MTDATIDLRRVGDGRPPQFDSQPRIGMLAMVGVGAGISALAAVAITGRLDPHLVGLRLVSDAIVLLTLVAVISTSKRSGIAQLRREIVADVVAQVSAVVASRVVARVEGQIEDVLVIERRREVDRLAAQIEAFRMHEEQLTRELARLRGQTNIGLRELNEAVQRVEARVTADLCEVYDLGKQSGKD